MGRKLALFVAVVLAISSRAHAAAPSAGGRSAGAIELPGQKREVLVLPAGEAGTWSGTIDIYKEKRQP